MNSVYRGRDEPYENLAAAIVYQAFCDLKRAAASYARRGTNPKTDQEIREGLQFFHSDYYQLLCDLNPLIFIWRILYEVR